MEEKKSSKSNVVVIVLLVLVILGLGGYILYDKVLVKKPNQDVEEKDNENKDKTEDKVENLEVTGDFVSGLVDGISSGIDCKDYREEYLFDTKFYAKNYSNEAIYNLVLHNMFDEVAANNNFVSFSADKVTTEVSKLVGKDYKFEHKTYDTCPTWEYDSSAMLYKAPTYSACGCTTGPYRNLYSTVKAEKIGDVVNIYQRVIFVDTSNGKGYKDKAKTKEITDLVRNTVDNYGNPSDSIKEDASNLSKGTLYKLVFEKENDNYIFVSSEAVSE